MSLYTAYNYDYWDDAIPSQSAYRVEKTVTGADMGLDRLSDPSDPLYISDDAPAKLSDAKDLFYDQDNDTFWVCDSGNNRILRLDTDLKVNRLLYRIHRLYRNICRRGRKIDLP